MRRILDILWSGPRAARRHAAASAVTVAILATVLLPYAAALGITQGLRDDAAASPDAQLVVSGLAFGRPAPVPLDLATKLRDLPGVVGVTPQIVGRVRLGRQRTEVVLVGLPPEQFEASFTCTQGRWPRAGARHELAISHSLARRLSLEIGSLLPPFYRNDRGERVSEIVGICRAPVSRWSADLMVTTLEDAAAIFADSGQVTELLVDCPAAAVDDVAGAVEGLRLPSPDGARLRLVAVRRADWHAELSLGFRQREGIFTLHWTLIVTSGILVMLVTSGAGVAERRREIGILKATGWQTDELLLQGFAHSACLGVLGGTIALLAAWTWLRLANGFWIAGWILPGAGVRPDFDVPFRLSAGAAGLTMLIALVVVICGSWLSVWRAAITPPRDAMR